ncbi:glycosyltransferase family 4 protein [Naasia sp. SYSU D00057]|uniref:glycosyltransferase family 4 protein n=1 Tax=Naasia sp. SYSU D00057 TaxID=2817380 RepID=UPI001B30ABEB|nr:glycosyltransferase family 4 protein [Naasia sp. SYSU D00057]
MRDARILVLHSSIELYGSDRMLLTVLRTLPPGVRAEVWLPDDVPFVADGLPAALTELGVDWSVRPLPVLRRRYLSPRGLLQLLPRIAALRAELRRSRPDALYVATSAMLLAAPVARRAGVPGILLHAQEIWSGFEGRLLSALAASVTTTVCISRAVQESLGGRVRAHSIVIDNAVPDSPDAPASPADEDRPLEFVVASRWNAWKGYETLLRAWDQGEPPGRLTVLGGKPPVGAGVDVPALVQGLTHPESVRVVGEVESVRPYLDSADVMVVPSDQPEPFGLVAIEAFSRARPVIASDGGGLADIVGSSTGWRFPLRDPDALRAVLDSVSRDAVVERGACARAVYEEKYSPQRFAEQFRSVWAALLA